MEKIIQDLIEQLSKVDLEKLEKPKKGVLLQMFDSVMGESKQSKNERAARVKILDSKKYSVVN